MAGQGEMEPNKVELGSVFDKYCDLTGRIDTQNLYLAELERSARPVDKVLHTLMMSGLVGETMRFPWSCLSKFTQLWGKGEARRMGLSSEVIDDVIEKGRQLGRNEKEYHVAEEELLARVAEHKDRLVEMFGEEGYPETVEEWKDFFAGLKVKKEEAEI